MAENTQAQIIKTSGEMFFKLGIRSVSIDDICHELGISKKTFYVYFDSKDELVAQLLHAHLNPMAQKMEEWLRLHDFRQLISILLAQKEVSKNDVRCVPQLVYDLKKYYPQQFSEFQLKLFELQKDYLKQYLEQGIREGLVREQLDVEMTAMLLAKLHADTIRDMEQIEAHGYSMHAYSQTAKDILIRGVLSEEGLALYNKE
ncbi:MAG: TetR/AcrR family transcriptional regulator [Paludibacteraceae bacterium]|nr:TetR/AcrR family transcriptional regulator [Paludibacteraceae bacterium]